MNVRVRVQDPARAVARDVELEIAEVASVGDLVAALVRLLEWPQTTMPGETIRYAIRREGGVEASSSTALADLKLRQGDLLVLGPVGLRVQ